MSTRNRTPRDQIVTKHFDVRYCMEPPDATSGRGAGETRDLRLVGGAS